MRKISGVFLIIILLMTFIGFSFVYGIQVYQPLEKYLFTRIVDIDTEWDYSLRMDEYTGKVTIIKFNLTAELWNSADEILTISFRDSIPYFIHMIDLRSNEDTVLNQGSDGIDTNIEFTPGLTMYSIDAVIVHKYIFERYPLGNYEVYFGTQLREIGNAFSVFFEITDNSTIVTYDDIPPDWGDTYDIFENSSISSTEIAFLPTMPIWNSIIGFIAIFLIKRQKIRGKTSGLYSW